MSALLADLQAKGLLDQTLMVRGIEFGLTPHINDSDDRDHHNRAFTCLLGGAGITGLSTHSDNFEGTPWEVATLD